ADKLHYLRGAVNSWPGERDPVFYLGAVLVAHERGRLSSRDLAHAALHLSYDHSLPQDLNRAIYDLDEAACCAHAYNGVPQPGQIRAARSALGACVERHTQGWRQTLKAVLAPQPADHHLE